MHPRVWYPCSTTPPALPTLLQPKRASPHRTWRAQVLPLGASKGAGVQWLLDHMGRDARHLMAMGDGGERMHRERSLSRLPAIHPSCTASIFLMACNKRATPHQHPPWPRFSRSQLPAHGVQPPW